MPGSGEIHYAQGSTVSFGGDIGQLLAFTISPGTAGVQDVTSLSSAVVGSGSSSRVLRQYEATSVDSGTATVRLLGCPPFTVDDIGTRETLTIVTDCETYAIDAILESFEVEGAVGELLKGSATFTVFRDDES